MGDQSSTPGGTAAAVAFRVGALECFSLDDGFTPVPTWLLAPEAPRDQLEALLAANGLDPLHLDNPISCLLIRFTNPARTVLIDTGMGTWRVASGGSPPSAGLLLASLAAAGIDPDEVDTILISHIHPDHVGGLFDADDRPVFANATYHVPEEERDFWGGEAPDLSGTLMPPPRRDDTIGVAKRFLALAAGRMRFFRGGDDPIDGVGSLALPGHSPGQVGFVIRDGAETLFYTADAVGHPIISIERPEWRFSFDADSDRAVATRRMLATQLVERGWRTFTPHFPRPAVGEVSDGDTGPVWRPDL